jgi:DMSO/TMAO reductase YedYZ heme-binding membrane subunit
MFDPEATGWIMTGMVAVLLLAVVGLTAARWMRR